MRRNRAMSATSMRPPPARMGSRIAHALADAAFAAGRWDDACDRWRAAGEDEPINLALWRCYAARVELWRGRIDAARTDLAVAATVDELPPAVATNVRAIAAGIAALDGRRQEALAGYAAVLAAWRASGARFDAALTAIDMAATLGPQEPAVRAAVAEARALLTGLGARPFLDRLDGFAAGG